MALISDGNASAAEYPSVQRRNPDNGAIQLTIHTRRTIRRTAPHLLPYPEPPTPTFATFPPTNPPHPLTESLSRLTYLMQISHPGPITDQSGHIGRAIAIVNRYSQAHNTGEIRGMSDAEVLGCVGKLVQLQRFIVQDAERGDIAFLEYHEELEDAKEALLGVVSGWA